MEHLDRLHERAEGLAGYLLSRLSVTPSDQRLEPISQRACDRAERRKQAIIHKRVARARLLGRLHGRMIVYSVALP